MGERSWEVSELRCLLVLAEELHFGATARRMSLTQARVSQLVSRLERRVGGSLFDRTSRRVELTGLGRDLRDAVEPALGALDAALERAGRSAAENGHRLTIGFEGTVDDHVVKLVDLFGRRRPGCSVQFVEVALNDPIGPLLRHELDTVFMRDEVEHPDLCFGPELLRCGRVLAIHDGHELAHRATIDVEELAEVTMLGIDGPAPSLWRDRASPGTTPGGRTVPHAGSISTFQEALASISADRGAMVFPGRVRNFHTRPGIAFVPIDGLPPVTLRFVWNRVSATQTLTDWNRFIDQAALDRRGLVDSR